MNHFEASRLACLRVPHLMAQVEQRRAGDQDGRPLLVCQGEVVRDACALASAQGVRAGEALRRALARCPTARVVPAEPRRYQEAWQAALERLALHTPAVEDARQGVAYLEARGLGALYGGEGAWCQAALAEVRQATDLVARMGVAGTRFATWVAACTSALPPGFEGVASDTGAFLAPFSVRWLPLSAETLRR
ncbi:MAG: hypothetical protein V1772_00705, partial [Chloroflexota bacterium]